jgi:hypothetical protein
MAVWTPPRTWTPGEFVTALMMNTHVRDNMIYLYDRIAGIDTTSGAWTGKAFIQQDSSAGAVGEGLEISYLPGSDLARIKAYDFTAGVFKPIYYDALEHIVRASGVEVVNVNQGKYMLLTARRSATVGTYAFAIANDGASTIWAWRTTSSNALALDYYNGAAWGNVLSVTDSLWASGVTVSAPAFRSNTGTTGSAAHNTYVTAFSIPATGLYIVYAWYGASGYMTWGIVAYNGSSASLIRVDNTALVEVGLSGTSVLVRQNSGSTLAGINWSYLRIAT